jgi:uncharacterized protein
MLMRAWYTRRHVLHGGAAVGLASVLPRAGGQYTQVTPVDSGHRPEPSQRRFRSEAVEAFLTRTAPKIADPFLRTLFVNCFPNTLDTTVEPGTFEGKPDTVVITGDIPAMWLRDSSAQVWPYLRFAKGDEALRSLLEGVIRRQTRCLLIDTYANAFMADLSAPALEWSRQDKTEMKQGVGERKYELDSICYPIRLAHGYWQQTGDTRPFDASWVEAMTRVVATMRVQQRRHGEGPYTFQRQAFAATDTLIDNGRGAPVKPVGLIASAFRPSDDACTYPFLVPSNLFAVTCLRQLSEMLRKLDGSAQLATEASALADEVEQALRKFAVVKLTSGESIWAYEIDGFGSYALMDDANAPSLLAIPYLNPVFDAALYARTRAFVWSDRNPWFFRGSAGEGIGGPHIGRDMIWPMSQIVYALTARNDAEIVHALGMLKEASAGSGFMHESYFKDDPKRFTRAWFAWANTLFGELIGNLAVQKPALLSR